jgi:hypothetical protein
MLMHLFNINLNILYLLEQKRLKNQQKNQVKRLKKLLAKKRLNKLQIE